MEKKMEATIGFGLLLRNSIQVAILGNRITHYI